MHTVDQNLIYSSQFKNVRNKHFSMYLLLIQMSTFYLSASFPVIFLTLVLKIVIFLHV